MKKIFTCLFMASFLNSIAYGNILTEKNMIKEEVLEIFWNFRKLFKQPKEFPDNLRYFKNSDANQRLTLHNLNDIAQKFFLRPKGQERLSEASKEHYRTLSQHLSQKEKKQIIKLFQTLGNIKKRLPTHTNPHYILIQGSSVQNMRERLMFVDEMARKGKLKYAPLNPPKVVFISGERPLFPDETREVLLNPAPYKTRKSWTSPDQLPTCESELSEFIWNQLDLGEELRCLKPQFVNAEKKEGTSRATTEDGAKKWLQGLEEAEEYCWVVSSNPYIEYQQYVMEWKAKQYLPHGQFIFEGIGQKASTDEHPLDVTIGILLDNLARTLYTLQQIKNT
jgi:hypothetical protein